MSKVTITGVGDAVKQGKFFYIPIEYTDKGRDFKKKVMDFANKEVYKTIKSAKVGDVFDVEVEKDNNGYWQWKTVTKASSSEGSTGSSGAVATSTLRSNYETSEERARRQVLIVRQSSLTSALKYFEVTGTGGTATEQDVLRIAETFEAWVHQNDEEVVDGDEDE